MRGASPEDGDHGVGLGGAGEALWRLGGNGREWRIEGARRRRAPVGLGGGGGGEKKRGGEAVP